MDKWTRTRRVRGAQCRRLLGLSLMGVGAASAASDGLSVDELTALSIEELADVRITSVSRVEEDLQSAAAAVSVVTSEEIERSGATAIPEALRLVPGLHVARQSASTWAVSARGFSSANSRNLLVLSDTRSIYTPLFSGVFWDVQDYLLNDVDRIEVIRGPGASLWGANAVNGVISITTKNAQNTQGVYAQAILGTEEQGVAARYGGRTAGDIYYRVFAKHSEDDNSYAPQAISDDAWQISHAGFRTDWERGEDDSFTVQGDVYDGHVGQIVPLVRVIGREGPEGQLEAQVRGGNVLARWKHEISKRSDFELRAYYDRTYRDDPSFEDTLETADIQIDHRLLMGERHEVLWGAQYRRTSNTNVGKGIFNVRPETSDDELYSMFVQDQIQVSDRLRLTVGTKAEYNDFTGTEVQPTVRAAWNWTPNHVLWAAVSHAVRVPTRYERDVFVDVSVGPSGEIYRLVGNPDFESEKVVAYELGYRWQYADNLIVDLATFYNDYEDLSSLELGEPFTESGNQLIVPLLARNLGEGQSHGFEALVTYQPVPFWRLTGSYSYVEMDLASSGMDINFERLIQDSTPRHQLGMRSSWDWRDYGFDVQLRYQDEVRSIPEVRTGEVVSPAYTEVDVRLSRQLSEHVLLSLVGQNLLDGHHPEFGSAAVRGEVERAAYLKVALAF